MAGTLNTCTHTQSQNNTRTSSTLARKQKKKTVQHSNDYAPDLLTPYFIITVEKKHSTIDLPQCFLFSLPLSLPLSPRLSFIPSFYFSLSRSDICKHKKTFLLKCIPVVNKIRNMQTLLRNYVHKHRTLTCIHKQIQRERERERRWTQYREHLCNLMQSSRAINAAFCAASLLMHSHSRDGYRNNTSRLHYNALDEH